VIINGKRRHH